MHLSGELQASCQLHYNISYRYCLILFSFTYMEIKHPKWKGLLCLIALQFSFYLGGQKLEWEYWTVEDGLSNNEVTDIYQDQFGWIWLATGHGLTSYNGYEFEVYRYHPFDSSSMGANYVETLFETGQGDIWAALSVGGLSRLDRASMSFRSYQSAWMENTNLRMSNSFVRALVEDVNGAIWLGTSAGLNKIDTTDSSFNRVWPNGDSERIRVNCILEYVPGQLLLGTHKGFYVYEVARSEAYRPLIQWRDTTWENNYAIGKIMQDQQGRIWLGAEGGGVFNWDIESDLLLPQWKKVDPALSGPQFCIELLEHEEGIWATFQHYGSKRIWSAEDTKDQDSIDLPMRWALQTDGKAVWGLDAEKNLVSVAGQSGEVYKRRIPGIDKGGISADLLSKDGAFWFSRNEGGLSRAYISRPVATQYYLQANSEEPIPNVRAMLTDSNGNLWLGNPKGLFYKGHGTGRVKHWPFSSSQIPGNTIYALAEDGSGQLWMATNGGVARLTLNTGKVKRYKAHFDNPHALSTDFVRGVNTDSQGRVWVGTSVGLHLYRPETDDFRRFFKEDHPNSLNGNDVRIVLEADTNSYWIGKVRTGLNRMTYHPEEDSISCTAFYFRGIHHFSDSLMTINSLTIDRNGELWLGTFSDGLLRFDTQQQAIVPVFENTQPIPGITAIQEDQDGCLWMGSHAGLYCYNPKTGRLQQFLENEGAQSSQFHIGSYASDRAGGLYFGGINGVNYIKPDDHFQALPLAPPQIVGIRKYGKDINFDRPVQYLEQLELSPEDGFFSIEFLSVNFQTKQDLRYRYRVEGLQEEWIELGNQRSVSFSHLPGGRYVFRVAVGDRQGNWSTQEAILPIVVGFPFHQTTTFYGIVIGGILFLAWGIYSLRWYFQRRKIMAMAAVREKAAADFHDELGHRLTKISLFTERIFHQNPKLEGESHQYLQKIKNNAGELYHSMRDFLWAMNPKKDALLELAILLKDFGDELFSHTPIVFRVEGIETLPEDVLLSMDWKRQLVLIFKEAMHNSLKHANSTQVNLRFAFSEGILHLNLEDNGVGFLHSNEQLGYGLRNMQQRAERINGQLDIKSSVQGGTAISFKGILQAQQLWNKKKAFR